MRPMRAVHFLVAVVAFAACDGSDNDQSEATGTVELTETDIAAPVSARLRKIKVEEGDVVRAGDTLAILE